MGHGKGISSQRLLVLDLASPFLCISFRLGSDSNHHHWHPSLSHCLIEVDLCGPKSVDWMRSLRYEPERCLSAFFVHVNLMSANAHPFKAAVVRYRRRRVDTALSTQVPF